MTTQVVEVVHELVQVVEVPFAVGPPGPAGAAGGMGFVHQQPIASATWSFSHPFSRRPAVAVYVDDELVDTDVSATSGQVVLTFPAPTAGTAVLT